MPLDTWPPANNAVDKTAASIKLLLFIWNRFMSFADLCLACIRFGLH
ncbi:hypothetical protein ACPOL_6633 [Acidisarcina polymorpha]|uniref:Uncharacterized protein n=1 Tax=Acidisarcina polymorpha TaxID=2211140 RepID=A0A2Z5GB38_9BACT|nr:hypothetical protein ACPOL_6633 [Acidisarcina polymorpha]